MKLNSLADKGVRRTGLVSKGAADVRGHPGGLGCRGYPTPPLSNKLSLG